MTDCAIIYLFGFAQVIPNFPDFCLFFFCQITPDTKLHLPKLPAPKSGVQLAHEATKDHKEEVTMENPKQLSVWSLCLPACRISESVQQLMELALNTLREAVGSSTQRCFSLKTYYVLLNKIQFSIVSQNLLR